jgi:hypothetical protein
MKLIDNILDDYFTKNLIKEIKYNIRIRNNVDTKIEYEKSSMGKAYTKIKILAKPRHYKNYTEIFYFIKGDSLNHLTSLKCAEKDYITEKIRKIDKENLWRK